MANQFDEVIKRVGSFGIYQKRLLLMVMFIQALISCQALLPVFILTNHKHWCKTQLSQDVTEVNETTSISVPVYNNSTSVSWATSCSVYTYHNVTNATVTSSCSEWEYNTSAFKTTPISDFDLVCDKELLKAHATMTFMGGNLLGSCILGIIGDTFGRKPVMYFGAISLFASSFAMAWSRSFVVFAVLRFLSGAATITCISSAMIIAFEMVGPSRRTLVVVCVEFAWCTGEVILCGLAYFIKDWRTLQIALSAPGVLMLSYWFLVPESPRWLQARGRTTSALRILNKTSRVNRMQYIETLDADTGMTERTGGLKEVVPLFRSPKLTARWIIVLFNWFVMAMAYYGLSFIIGNLAGNLYVNFAISAVMEAVAYSLCLYTSTKFGRKKFTCGSFLIAGVACLATIFTSLYANNDSKYQWITPTLAIIGKMGISAVFAGMFTFSSELFPTTIRSFILASANVGGRIGSTLSPYVSDMGNLVDTSFGKALPLVVYGILSLSAGLLSFLLPETLHSPLPESINDMKRKEDQKKLDGN